MTVTGTWIFLDELYGDWDYERRNQQFARISNTIARLFQVAVADAVATLDEVHASTENSAIKWRFSGQAPTRQACCTAP